MSSIAIAMDLGTSGFRAQAIDLSNGEILSTVITTRHPLPGANVMDHLHFALEMGVDVAGTVIVAAINKVVDSLQVPIDKVVRLAVCGNPIQLSLFQRSEILDLAFAGKRKLEALGVVGEERNAAILSASCIPGLGLLKETEILVPPSLHHVVGADALAMLIQTGVLESDETALATDYGTNAEMALCHQGHVITGSASAGPALEGQQIRFGMLAMPGAISDLVPESHLHRLTVLDAEMCPAAGSLVDLRSNRVVETGAVQPTGITGTGTIAIMNQCMEAGLITLPRINTPDTELHVWGDIVFTEDDVMEAGKAIGAVRAGHITLCNEAGIGLEDIDVAYMCGASGTYVDALKAQRLGIIPPRVRTIYQVGNTSLAMSRDLASDPKKLDAMEHLAKHLRQEHCMFAASEVFAKVYVLELAYWTEGMPLSQYHGFLKRYGLPIPLSLGEPPEVIRTARRDIGDLGCRGLITIADMGQDLRTQFEDCVGCLECLRTCSEKALVMTEDNNPQTFVLDQSLCRGLACRRCERICPEKCFSLRDFFVGLRCATVHSSKTRSHFTRR